MKYKIPGQESLEIEEYAGPFISTTVSRLELLARRGNVAFICDGDRMKREGRL